MFARSRTDDLTPQPRWRQYRDHLVAWWRRSGDSRRRAYGNLRKAGRKGLTLAISMLGAILVSFGVWSAYHPAGYIVAGLLLWAIQWNYGKEEGSG